MVDTIKVLDFELREPLTGDQLGLFAWGTEDITFKKTVLKLSKPPQAFVVMRFAEPYQSLYEDVIAPVAREMSLSPQIVSDVQGPGIILQDITQGLAEAKVIVAEITPPNENVFYELGYAHALRKPTILLAERGRQLPFDISGYRVIFYDNTIRGKKEVEDRLRKHLTAILGGRPELVSA